MDIKSKAEALWEEIINACEEINIEGDYLNNVVATYTPRMVAKKLHRSISIEEIISAINEHTPVDWPLFQGPAGPDTPFRLGKPVAEGKFIPGGKHM